MTGPQAQAEPDGRRATTPPAGRPVDRYGRRDPAVGRRRAVVGGALLAAGLTVWAAWAADRHTDRPATWATGGMTVVDDGHVTLEMLVTMDPGRTAVCTVRLFNSGLTEVGRSEVSVGPGTERTISKTVTIATFEAAASGTVHACAVR